MTFRERKKNDSDDVMSGLVNEEGFYYTEKTSDEYEVDDVESKYEISDEDNEAENINNSHKRAKYSKNMSILQPFDVFVTPTSKICLLIFLYILQGVPLGLGASLPYLLQARKVSYKEQALFSLIYWPFSLKLFWAPIVDSSYFPAFGRRKSWLIPTQYLIGISMFFLSHHIDFFMGDNPHKHVSIGTLTIIFFLINFLAATQDIAVDGWALTMLGKSHSGWVSTCNSVGQTIGYMFGNLVFLSLESQEFSNAYLRSSPAEGGVVSFAGYLHTFSIIFFVSTSLVWLLKREVMEVGLKDYSVPHVYRLLYRIVLLPSVLKLMVLLLTVKMAFAANEAISSLKLIEVGVPKEKIAMLATPTIPLNIILPILITRFTPQKRPIEVLLSAYPFRLFFSIMSMWVVWWAPSTKMMGGSGDGVFPYYFYAICVVLVMLQQVTVACTYVPIMTFFALVSDPTIGGTYMTLLNTISNLGGNWPQTLALFLVEYVTLKGCVSSNSSCSLSFSSCGGANSCIYLDGYYVLSWVGVASGVVWLWLASGAARRLQHLRPHEWSISRSIR